MAKASDVLVIDDEQDRLDELVNALAQELGDEASVRPWLPARGQDPLERFSAETSANVGLIVTDQDLTKSGLGLLGSSITSWAQDKFLPVCNFSRQPQRKLPRERNFFELRVPQESDEEARAAYIARIYHGFKRLREHIGGASQARPNAALLADAMGAPELQDDLAPFFTSVASANSSFMQAVVATDEALSKPERTDLLAFILGHILVNAVLEFPGPILSRPTLAAYCAVSEEASDELATLFAGAAYNGPFAAPGMYFQRRLVDARIDELAEDGDQQAAEADEYNRAVAVRALGRTAQHGCDRCGGMRGGYWCPFTRRAVCNREDCSVTTNAWIPRGATLCRVERDYFDEWAPLLGV